MANESFTVFFGEDIDRLVGFLCKAGYDREIARDAAAEAMTRLLETWTQVTRPRAWVRTVASRIASRLALEGPRSRNAALAGCWLSTTDQTDDHAQHAVIEEQPLILAMLRQLPDMQRLVLAWQLDGFEATEIAEQIGAKPETVRSNLRHARDRLRVIYTRQATEAMETTTQPGTRWR